MSSTVTTVGTPLLRILTPVGSRNVTSGILHMVEDEDTAGMDEDHGVPEVVSEN